LEFAIYYTLGAVLLYGITDWVLNRIEEARGRRFAQRNVIFFIILFVLALVLMEIINPAPTPPAATPAPTEQQPS